MRTIDYYCNGEDAEMHEIAITHDTCGQCELCIVNNLECQIYDYRTECIAGRCDDLGNCITCRDECFSPFPGGHCSGDNILQICDNLDNDPCYEYEIMQCPHGCTDGECNKPDLTVSDLIIQGPENPGINEDIVLAFTIENTGMAPAEEVFWLVDTGSADPNSGNSVPLSLAIGERSFIFTRIFYSSAGTYTAKAVVDQNERIEKMDESNNEMEINIFVSSDGHRKPEGVLGDVNCDGALDISDVVFLLNYLFSGGESGCLENADFNEDGDIDIGDAIRILDYLF